LKADATSLGNFFRLDKNLKFIIPVYQRNYDWTDKQCKTLFFDIERIHIKNQTKHFIGSIVYISNTDNNVIGVNEYVVIDGQQRLTTSMLFLKALYDLSDNEIIKEEILEEFLINKRAENNKLKLKPIKKDEEVFVKLISNDMENIDKQSKIYINYKNFKKWITKSSLSVDELFIAFQKLWVVHIGLIRGEDDPQLIFESINSTGLSLSEADLIRNFILMDKEPKIQEEFFNRYWIHIEENLASISENISAFFHHYLVMKLNRTVKLSEVYDEFKEYVFPNEQDPIDNVDIENILKDLLYFSKIYSLFLFPSHIDDLKTRSAIEDIKYLKMTVIYPYLMVVYDLFQKNNISQNTLLQILSTLESYDVRRIIKDKRTSGLNKAFMSLSKEIRNLKSFSYEKYYEYFSYVLLNKKGSSEFPSDSEFKQSFLSRNMYDLRIVDYILLKMENYNNKEKIINGDSITIEHIMPQTLTEEWKKELGNNYQLIHDKYLHTIGNLTLTGYNSELGNKSFLEKKRILEKSKLALNKDVVLQEKWTQETIEKRATKLFEKFAKNIWDIPSISIELKESLSETYSIEDNNSVTYKTLTSFSFFQTEEVYTWREFVEKFLLQIYENDNEKFLSLFSDNVESRVKRIISKDQSNFADPKEIIDGVYIEQHGSANAMLKAIKYIYNYLNYGSEEYDNQIELVYSIKNN
jgi:uncharacterized protein with ParB-like and HNH nuclease domain